MKWNACVVTGEFYWTLIRQTGAATIEKRSKTQAFTISLSWRREATTIDGSFPLPPNPPSQPTQHSPRIGEPVKVERLLTFSVYPATWQRALGIAWTTCRVCANATAACPRRVGRQQPMGALRLVNARRPAPTGRTRSLPEGCPPL